MSKATELDGMRSNFPVYMTKYSSNLIKQM